MYRQSEKNLLSSSMSSTCPPQYGELRPTSGWDPSGSLGDPSIPQQISTGFASWQRYFTAPSSGRQPNCATYVRQGNHHVGHWPTF